MAEPEVYPDPVAKQRLPPAREYPVLQEVENATAELAKAIDLQGAPAAVAAHLS